LYKDKANFSFMENRQYNGSHQIIAEEGGYVGTLATEQVND